MRSLMNQLARVAGLAALAAVTAGPVAAQCTNLTGEPAPVPELLASKIKLGAAAGGLWNDGNDKFKFLKGFFSPTMPINPRTTHKLHFTLRHIDGVDDPEMLAFTIYPNDVDTWWTEPAPGRFSYNDGSIKIKMRDLGGFVAYKLIARHANIVFPSLVSGDTVHMMLEVEDGGDGHCGDRTGICLVNGAQTIANCR